MARRPTTRRRATRMRVSRWGARLWRDEPVRCALIEYGYRRPESACYDDGPYVPWREDEDPDAGLARNAEWRYHVALVLWRETKEHDIVPAWLPDKSASAYGRMQTLWALAGEPMCERYHVPASFCAALDQIARAARLLNLAPDDWIFTADVDFVGYCGHGPSGFPGARRRSSR